MSFLMKFFLKLFNDIGLTYKSLIIIINEIKRKHRYLVYTELL